MRRGRLIITILLLVEAGITGMYFKERHVAEGRPNSVSFDGSVIWGGRGRDYPRSATLHKGHIYVTGSTSSFGAGKDDIFLLKYTMDGELVWNRTWGGADYDMGRGIAAADDGVYVLGFTNPDGEYDAVLLKYDSEGQLIWARRWSAVEAAIGRSVAVDDGGFVYVAGYVGGITANVTEPFLLKYGPGGELIWNRTWGEAGAYYCWGVEVDDGVYVGGARRNLGGVQTVKGGTPLRRSEMFLAKFDFDGEMVWMRSWGDGVENYGWALSAWNGRIYQVGFTQEEADADAVTLGYDPSGSLIFSSLWGGRYEDYAWDIEGGGEFIYVVGHTTVAEPWSVTDALIMKYKQDGTLLWNVTWGGFGLDRARSVVVNGDSIYVVGITYGLGRDGQAFLLRYTSPNETVSPLSAATTAGAIAVGLIIWMTLILECVAK